MEKMSKIIALVGIAACAIIIVIYLNSSHSGALERTVKIAPKDIPVISNQNTKSDAHKVPPDSVLRDAHEHASILVKIFGSKFDFSSIQFQLMSPWIHFEGSDGNTIHRHSRGITLGYLFDTMNLGLTQDCFVVQDGREFCNNNEDSLKFYINGNKIQDIQDYVIFDNDRILISYGHETPEEIKGQFEELESQELLY